MAKTTRKDDLKVATDDQPNEWLGDVRAEEVGASALRRYVEQAGAQVERRFPLAVVVVPVAGLHRGGRVPEIV